MKKIRKLKKALFLDRDGIINYDYGYVYKKEKIHFCEGIFEITKFFSERNFLVIVITNQSGIARGLFSEKEFLELMKWLVGEFRKKGSILDKYYYCPYHKDGTIEKYKKDSFMRKPNPGMILKAIKDLNIDCEKSFFIGDNITDILAAERSSVGTRILIGNGNETNSDLNEVEKPYLQFKNLKTANKWLSEYFERLTDGC